MFLIKGDEIVKIPQKTGGNQAKMGFEGNQKSKLRSYQIGKGSENRKS